jgi:hypothetical protein
MKHVLVLSDDMRREERTIKMFGLGEIVYVGNMFGSSFGFQIHKSFNLKE